MDHLKTKVKEHELDKQEGDELKKLAIQYEIEKKKLDQIRMEEKLQLGKSNIQKDFWLSVTIETFHTHRTPIKILQVHFIVGLDNKKQISDRQKLLEIEKQQEEEEDDECRIFAAAKRKMAKLRMEKERQLHKYV